MATRFGDEKPKGFYPILDGKTFLQLIIEWLLSGLLDRFLLPWHAIEKKVDEMPVVQFELPQRRILSIDTDHLRAKEGR